MWFTQRLGSILVALLLSVTTLIVDLDPWPLYLCPALLAFGCAIFGFSKAFRFFAAVTVGLLVKEAQLKAFAHAINVLAATGAYCLADWHRTYEIQMVVPLIVGAYLHCRVSEACPDISIQDYAQAQRAILLSLVGLSTLSIVLRVFDQAKVVGDIAGLVLRAASLASAGIHIFLESAICQSEEGEIVRGMYGVMAGVALM